MTLFFHKKMVPECKPEWNREAIMVFPRLPSLRRLQATPPLQTSLVQTTCWQIRQNFFFINIILLVIFLGRIIKLRVSIQEVKSLCGDCVVFPGLGTRDIDRWSINRGLFATCQCSRCPNFEKRRDPPKMI